MLDSFDDLLGVGPDMEEVLRMGRTAMTTLTDLENIAAVFKNRLGWEFSLTGRSAPGDFPLEMGFIEDEHGYIAIGLFINLTPDEKDFLEKGPFQGALEVAAAYSKENGYPVLLLAVPGSMVSELPEDGQFTADIDYHVLIGAYVTEDGQTTAWLHRGPDTTLRDLYRAHYDRLGKEDLDLFEPLESDESFHGEFMIEFVREMSEATMPKSLEASLSTAMETMSEVADSLEKEASQEAQRAERMNRAERRARKAKKRKGQRF